MVVENNVDGMLLVPKLCDGIVIPLLASTFNGENYVIGLPEGTHYMVSCRILSMIRLIDGRRDVHSISKLLSDELLENITSQQVTRIIERALIPEGIVSFGDYFLSPKRGKKSPIWLQLPFLSEQLVNLLATPLKVLFTWKGVIPTTILILSSHIWFYTFNSRSVLSDKLLTAEVWGPVTLLLILSGIAHELGHASALQSFGEKPGPIGLGIYFFMPVFYADVSRSWRLPRLSRVVVDIGGLYIQLLFASLIIGIFAVTNTPNFAYATTLIDFTLISNLNPFLKLDGYWLLADLTNTRNLREKSFIGLQSITCRSSQAKPVKFWFLILYASLSQLFFLYFLLNIVTWVLPRFVREMSGNVYRIIAGLDGNPVALDKLFNPLFSLALGGLVIIGTCMTILRLVRYFLGIFASISSRKYQLFTFLGKQISKRLRFASIKYFGWIYRKKQ